MFFTLLPSFNVLFMLKSHLAYIAAVLYEALAGSAPHIKHGVRGFFGLGIVQIIIEVKT